MTQSDEPQTQSESEVIELFGIPVRALKNVPGMPENRLLVTGGEALDALRKLKAIGIRELAEEAAREKKQ